MDKRILALGSIIAIIILILTSFNSVIGFQSIKSTIGNINSMEPRLEIRIWYFGVLNMPVVIKNTGNVTLSKVRLNIEVTKNTGNFRFIGRPMKVGIHELTPGEEEAFSGPWVIGTGTINITVKAWADEGAFCEAYGKRLVLFIFILGNSQNEKMNYIIR